MRNFYEAGHDATKGLGELKDIKIEENMNIKLDYDLDEPNTTKNADSKLDGFAQ